MDTIHVRNLIFSGKHGVYEDERKIEQEFQIDLVVCTDLSAAGATDDLASTIDYDTIKERVRSVIEGATSFLIEKIAQDIADSILMDANIQSVTVTIQKIAVWKNGVPGVTITRTKAL